MSRTGKPIEGRLLVAGSGQRVEWGVIATGFFWGDENVLELYNRLYNITDVLKIIELYTF